MRKLFRFLWRIITFPFRWIGIVLNESRAFFSVEPDDVPLADSLQKAVENPVDILYHLNELRKHIFRAVGFLLITTLFSLLFTAKIIDYMAQPIGGISKLVAIEVTEPLGVYMRVALLSGFTLAFPYICLELWMFAAPGLHRSSRLFGLASIPIATIFFAGGMAFAFYVMLPQALPFLLHIMGMTTIPRPSSYVEFTTGIMFWLGVAFEFPLVIYVLASVGLIKAKLLADQWRIAIVVIAISAAMITPTVDPVNMSLVMFPMFALYFLSIGLALLAQRGKNKDKVEEE